MSMETTRSLLVTAAISAIAVGLLTLGLLEIGASKEVLGLGVLGGTAIVGVIVGILSVPTDFGKPHGTVGHD